MWERSTASVCSSRERPETGRSSSLDDYSALVTRRIPPNWGLVTSPRRGTRPRYDSACPQDRSGDISWSSERENPCRTSAFAASVAKPARAGQGLPII